MSGKCRRTYHQQGPDGVVQEDDRGGHEHGEADEFVELLWSGDAMVSFSNIIVEPNKIY